MDEVASGADAAQLLARDLRRSVSTFVRTIRQDTGTVKSAQSEALDLLHQLGAMNVASLAERRRVTHQTMRLVVAQLEADTLVRQEADPADRRSRLISITPAGIEMIAREREARESRIEDAIRRRLSPRDRELLRLAIPILDRLAEAAYERHPSSIPTIGAVPEPSPSTDRGRTLKPDVASDDLRKPDLVDRRPLRHFPTKPRSPSP